jgi:hypothetical protein
MAERRIGKEPIPRIPSLYLTTQQSNGLMILNQFGWKLFCIRRANHTDITTILWHSGDRMIGTLAKDGSLKLYEDLKIRDLGKAVSALH